jgi:hypothetical protein
MALNGVLVSNPAPLQLFHGAARLGADYHADQWAQDARRCGHDVQVRRFPAEWSRGRQAGRWRNQEMVGVFSEVGGGVCLAFLRDGTPGTTHAIQCAARRSNIITVIFDYAQADRIEADMRERLPPPLT